MLARGLGSFVSLGFQHRRLRTHTQAGHVGRATCGEAPTQAASIEYAMKSLVQAIDKTTLQAREDPAVLESDK